MTCSARASSSPVLIPGRVDAATAARARATRAPAVLIASISAGVLSSMSRPRHRASTARTPLRVPLVTGGPSRAGQRVREPLRDLVNGPDRVDADDLAVVVLEQRRRLVAVDLLPVADDVLGVVATPPG